MGTSNETGLIKGDDGHHRCWWGAAPDDYRHYHDTEWGFPVDDDHRLFEKICLEGFQAGLSWLTILRKRENFRESFCGFNYHKVARFKEREVKKLLSNAGIIRHRGKIEATINNAQRAIEMETEFGSLADYFWKFVPPPEERPARCDYATLSKLAQTPTSQELSKDLRARGWKFVGPTTVYAFMQAMGLVNDHLEGCFLREPVEKARQKFLAKRSK